MWEGVDVGNAQWAKHAAPPLRQCKSLVKYTRECYHAGLLPVGERGDLVLKKEGLTLGDGEGCAARGATTCRV